MRVVAVTSVKNEIDIIEAFVRHTLAIVDSLVALDHGSRDGTLEVLQKLANQGLPVEVVEDPEPGKYQAQRMTRLMREHAVGRLGADWVVPLDADEFLIPPPNGQPLLAGADSIAQPVALYWRTYVPDPDEDPRERNPVCRIRRRRVEEGWPWFKIMVPRALAGRPDARLSQGNHSLFVGEVPCAVSLGSQAFLAHFPIRSPGQYLAKVAVSTIQYQAMGDRDYGWGYTYREPFELLKKDPRAFALSFHEAARRYALPPEVESEVETVVDPIAYRGGALTVTPEVDDEVRGWVAVVTSAEDLAQRYAILSSCLSDADHGFVRRQAAVLAHLQAECSRRDRLLVEDQWKLSRSDGRARALEQRLLHEHLLRQYQERELKTSWTWRIGRLLVSPVGAWARWWGATCRSLLSRFDAPPRRVDRPLSPLSSASRIILGAAATSLEGWASTDRDVLDVTRRGDFARHWEPSSREAFLAEHVWEHLTDRQAAEALANCFEFLKPGGRLRIAVPDGLHPDPSYLAWVRPGGVGPGADDHQVLYDYRTLRAQLRRAGFEVLLLEYWDESGCFHAQDWSPQDGFIRRSARHDQRNQGGHLRYTSLIVDAIKAQPAWPRIAPLDEALDAAA